MDNSILLSVENIHMRFKGLLAVDDASLLINRNEIVGLIGTNGAGKTTLFNIIAGDLSPTSGRVLFNGKKIDSNPSYKICKMGIARTYQIVKPFLNLTVLENVMVGALIKTNTTKIAKEKAEETLHLVGLDNRRDVLGNDLNLPELKRLELARALATEPKLLLLDEVMAGLNPVESSKVIDLVKRIRESGLTILIIEHVIKAIMNLSDRIYVMNQGRIISAGNPEKVIHDPIVISSYLGEKHYAVSE